MRSHFPPELSKPFGFLSTFGNQLDLGMDLEALLGSAQAAQAAQAVGRGVRTCPHPTLVPHPILLLCRTAKSKFSGGE